MYMMIMLYFNSCDMGINNGFVHVSLTLWIRMYCRNLVVCRCVITSIEFASSSGYICTWQIDGIFKLKLPISFDCIVPDCANLFFWNGGVWYLNVCASEILYFIPVHVDTSWIYVSLLSKCFKFLMWLIVLWQGL